jgi:RimJ/RimL family protein N-acetyltransferase
MSMSSAVLLRDVIEDDLAIFFEHQSDPDACWMAAFTFKDPSDREAFMALWTRLLASPSIILQTIIVEGQVAGCVMGYEEIGRPEVSYWLGKTHWGRGIATQALTIFLAEKNSTRPIFARSATDNVASLRVLEKCGFTVLCESRGFANARGEEIEEFLLQLS